MLVFMRYRGEKSVITVPPSDVPTRIEVMVVDVLPGKARLGFDAPRDVAIHRDEIQAEIDREGSRRP